MLKKLYYNSVLFVKCVSVVAFVLEATTEMGFSLGYRRISLRFKGREIGILSEGDGIVWYYKSHEVHC